MILTWKENIWVVTYKTNISEYYDELKKIDLLPIYIGLYFYPSYFPVGRLIQLFQQKGWNLEVVW